MILIYVSKLSSTARHFQRRSESTENLVYRVEKIYLSQERVKIIRNIYNKKSGGLSHFVRNSYGSTCIRTLQSLEAEKERDFHIGNQICMNVR